jgi:hypothetical protein
MKSILYFLLFLAVIIHVSSCSRDCSKTVCGYNQVCTNGNCFCVNGYEGDSCNKLAAPKYTGRTWYPQGSACANISGGAGSVYFQSSSTSASRIVVYGIGSQPIDLQITSTANKTGNYIQISPDDQTFNGTYTVSGHGEYIGTVNGTGTSSSKIVFYLTLSSSGAASQDCQVTLY